MARFKGQLLLVHLSQGPWYGRDEYHGGAGSEDYLYYSLSPFQTCKTTSLVCHRLCGPFKGRKCGGIKNTRGNEISEAVIPFIAWVLESFHNARPWAVPKIVILGGWLFLICSGQVKPSRRQLYTLNPISPISSKIFSPNTQKETSRIALSVPNSASLWEN